MPTSIFFILVVAALLASTSAQNPIFLGNMPIGHPGNYTEASAYQNNLQNVLSTLDSSSSASSYSETSAGNGSDTVYGRYYCRHDVPLTTCTACVHAATKKIVSGGVHNSKEAIIWYVDCTLLYLTNSSRLDALDAEQFPSLSLVDVETKVTDPERFRPVLMETMDRVINGSAYGPGSDGFATAEAKVAPFTTLYSLAQCSWDTPGLLCERCLRRALHEYTICCMDTTRMGFFYATCQLRYSVVTPFYDVRRSTPAVDGPPPAPSVTSQPSTSTTHDQPSQGNRSVGRSCSNIMHIGFLIALITLMLLKN